MIKWVYWYPKYKHHFKWHWWEYILLPGVICCHIYRWNIFATILFYSGANVAYALHVLPNHDAWESMANYDTNVKDWGEM